MYGEMSVKGMLKKTKVLYCVAQKARRLPYPLLRFIQRIYNRVSGIRPNTVYFSSFNGSLYNDNPRAIAEALHEVAPTARIVFRLNKAGMNDPRIPVYVVRVPQFSLRALKEMATARVLVKNAGMRDWMLKFPGQYYIQTWHGDRGFKKIRLDLGESAAHRQEADWLDLMTAGSAFGDQVNHSAFGYKGESLMCGCPRNDILVNRPADLPERVRRAVGIPQGMKVLMYAPTFRNVSIGGGQKASLDIAKVKARLEETTGEKWCCVTRSHELALRITSNSDRDLSDYPEAGELLLITDLLITDYSSIGGDFALLNRPVIFFQPDRERYVKERGLYFDPDQSPLMVAHDETELLAMLTAPIDWTANCREMLDFFGSCESGTASRQVAERIAAVLCLL